MHFWIGKIIFTIPIYLYKMSKMKAFCFTQRVAVLFLQFCSTISYCW